MGLDDKVIGEHSCDGKVPVGSYEAVGPNASEGPIFEVEEVEVPQRLFRSHRREMAARGFPGM